MITPVPSFTKCLRHTSKAGSTRASKFGIMLPQLLYRNDAADIIVLDLPASLSQAQESSLLLCSTDPPDEVYVTPEPKGPKRDALFAAIPRAEQEYHLGVQQLIKDTLTVLHLLWHEARWCHARVTGHQGQVSAQSDCVIHHKHSIEPYPRAGNPPLVLSPDVDKMCCASALTDLVALNPHASATRVVLSHGGHLIIPPRSTFLCASVQQGQSAFEDAIHCLLPHSQFDLILLDPPWTNRSARRSRAYRTVENQRLDPFDHVLPIVSACLNEHGYIAVWVTNKAIIRSQVIQACAARGLMLVEEWFWLKVTTKGTPVTPLDGMWRRPYELLLLFHRTTTTGQLVRRVCIAVPDLHSRKPSLKTLFEQFLPQKYNALEVFARNLTAGWWSWGDEVLLFQHESKWTSSTTCR